MSLRLKFNLTLLIAFIAGLVIAGAVVHRIVVDQARAAVIQDARLMMQSATAIRNYTEQEIEPLLAAQAADRFLPQSIPFFAAEANFRSLQKEYPDYSYKEATLNPTNPADRASDWETDIINIFRRDAKLPELITERDSPTGRLLSLSRPLQISDAGCLTCHSTPSAAPPSMIKLYGSANGFGWKPQEIVGASIVSVPMSVALDRADRTFQVFMIVLVAVFATIIVLLNLLLEVVVVRPVVRIARIAGQVSLGNMAAEEYEMKGKDEIASLSASFNRMRRSLEEAMTLLEK
jgi:HAMP domain-containing protein